MVGEGSRLVQVCFDELQSLISTFQRCQLFRSAYPHAPEDEYLANYIADVANDAAV